MRGITITYRYSGDEAEWQSAVQAFISAINDDQAVAGRFTYQVSIADDGVTRIHWGRWDSAETRAHVQAQPYFTTFAGKIKEFIGGPPAVLEHDVYTRTGGW